MSQKERNQAAPSGAAQPVQIMADGQQLLGDLMIPERAFGIVVFAHGSGSSRHSTRNRFVAGELQRAGMATLLLDLLSRDEEEREAAGAMLRFDIDVLTTRLLAATDWVHRTPSTRALPVGYFGASTGAAAALAAAAAQKDAIAAVVSRGGRPDLVAPDVLARVTAPTLLIVGGADTEVLALNRRVDEQLRCAHKLKVIAGATHLFEEPGTLEAVSEQASDWFSQHLKRTPRSRAPSATGAV